MTNETVPVTQADREAAADWLDQWDVAIKHDHVRRGRDRHTLVQAFARHRLSTKPGHDALVAENARLREDNDKLRKRLVGQWFYPPDGYESESCMYSPAEVIDYLDLEPGDHVVEVNVATSLPSIWCAVRVTADEDADERYTFTEHDSADAARAALATGEA